MRYRPTDGHRHKIHTLLWVFYDWCVPAGIPELTTLAQTIQTWWPTIEVFLTNTKREPPAG